VQEAYKRETRTAEPGSFDITSHQKLMILQ